MEFLCSSVQDCRPREPKHWGALGRTGWGSRGLLRGRELCPTLGEQLQQQEFKCFKFLGNIAPFLFSAGIWSPPSPTWEDVNARIWFWQMNYPRSWSRRSCPIAAFRLEHYLNIDSPFSDTKYSKYCGKLNGNTTKPLYQLGQKSHNTFPDRHIFRIISFSLASWVPEPNNFL